jgi:Ca-activated chloride channel family protein
MIRRSQLAACLACVLLLAHAPLSSQSPQRPAPPRQEPQIKVEVALVNVLVSVLDAAGRPVPDLPKDAFEVYEEGVKQQVDVFESETQQPLDLALMIDSSLSTLKELAFEREAAARFIRQVVRPVDRLAVFEFADRVTQLSEFSADVPRLQHRPLRRVGARLGSHRPAPVRSASRHHPRHRRRRNHQPL